MTRSPSDIAVVRFLEPLRHCIILVGYSVPTIKSVVRDRDVKLSSPVCPNLVPHVRAEDTFHLSYVGLSAHLQTADSGEAHLV